MIAISDSNKKWADDTWEKIAEKMEKVVAKTAGKIPYTTVDGTYDDKSDGKERYWWTNGFWPGMLWLMFNQTGKDIYKDEAQAVEDKLYTTLTDSVETSHHDVGFIWLHSAIANYKLTGCEQGKDRGYTAANYLSSRYNIKGEYITAWNGVDRQGWSIIDTMMNIPLLYWATETSGYDRFKFIADAHAKKTMENVIRSDGSVHHIVVYDNETGEMVDTRSGQGFEKGSSWSRGQGWALHGFALAYNHTGNNEYLETAKRVAHYFISNVYEDWIPKIDFRSPEAPCYIDTTAAAIAASGLIEIAKASGEYDKNIYLNAAINILKALDEKYCIYDDSCDAIVQMGSEAYEWGIHKTIIYGDFFFIEAICKLRGMELSLW